MGAGYSICDKVGVPATFVDPLPIPFLGVAALVLIGRTKLIPKAITRPLLNLSRGCLVPATTALGMQTARPKLAAVAPRTIVCGLTALIAAFSLSAILTLHI